MYALKIQKKVLGIWNVWTFSFLCHNVLITNMLAFCLFVNFEQSYTKPPDLYYMDLSSFKFSWWAPKDAHDLKQSA